MTQPGVSPPTPPVGLVPGDPHASYRSERLLHEPPDERLSGTVTLRALRPHATRSILFLAAFVAYWGLSFVFTLVGLAVAVMSADPLDPEPSGQLPTFLTVTWYLLLIGELVVVGLWIVALLVPTREPISEYGLLVEDQGHAAPQAYWWIAETMRRRRAPFQVRHGQAGRTPIMVVSNGRIRGVIVIHAVGADLYLGWAMWRSRSTVMLAIHLIRDLFQAAGGQQYASDVRSALNRELRELLHSVVREGAQAGLRQPAPRSAEPEPEPEPQPEPAPAGGDPPGGAE
jgi:hypothetical protein